MNDVSEPLPVQPPAVHGRSRSATVGRVVLAVVGLYLIVAYLVLPAIWHRDEEVHPALANAQKITRTKSGIPGDPVNIGLVGTEEDVQRSMLDAKWFPADPITLESSLRIAADVVLRRPYADAPVSSLYLFGRIQDLAFEQPVGDNPRQRHHVRFWRSKELDAQRRPLWFGAATMDIRVGFSHDTGQITHHIGPDIDAERDKIIAEIEAAGDLARVYWVDDFHTERSGKNGGGDPWHTDGRMAVGVIALHDHAP